MVSKGRGEAGQKALESEDKTTRLTNGEWRTMLILIGLEMRSFIITLSKALTS